LLEPTLLVLLDRGGGFEFPLVLLGLAFVITALGAGSYSVNAWAHVNDWAGIDLSISHVAEVKDIPRWVNAFTEDGTITDMSTGVTYRGETLGERRFFMIISSFAQLADQTAPRPQLNRETLPFRKSHPAPAVTSTPQFSVRKGVDLQGKSRRPDLNRGPHRPE
jgi:hypothetical protein